MTTYSEGDAFPDFTMETPDGGTLTKADLAGRKAVIFFYPKDNTPGCTTEAKDFTALKPEFEKAGTRLIGVSKDSAKKHQNFIAKHDLTVELATDAEENGLSDTLGVWGEKKKRRKEGHSSKGLLRSGEPCPKKRSFKRHIHICSTI